MCSQRLLHACNNLSESPIEHQLVAELPCQHGFEEDAPRFFRVAGIVRIERVQPLLYF